MSKPQSQAKSGLCPLIDDPWDHQQGNAMQGFASGDCERDAQAINIFMEDGHAMGCSQSYAKNMGLYGQRIGCFSIITEDPKEAVKVESQMKVHLFLYMHSGVCLCMLQLCGHLHHQARMIGFWLFYTMV
jgi:hypothetical protein